MFPGKSLDRAAQFLKLAAEVDSLLFWLGRRHAPLLLENMDSAHQIRQLLGKLARALLHFVHMGEFPAIAEVAIRKDGKKRPGKQQGSKGERELKTLTGRQDSG